MATIIDGKRVCGRTKSDGQPCRNPPAPGRDWCRFHGGAALRGIAHPNFKNGVYSKSIPARLAESYEAGLQDGELLSIRSDIALVQARTKELLGQVDTGESGALFKKFSQVYGELVSAIRSNNGADVTKQLTEFRNLVTQGLSEYNTWNEIYNNIGLMARLRESEMRRLVMLEQMISLEDTMTIMRTLLYSVTQNVTDRTALSKIQKDFDLAVTRLYQ